MSYQKKSSSNLLFKAVFKPNSKPTNKMVTNRSVGHVLLKMLYFIYETIIHNMFKFVYGKSTRQIPPLDNLLLTDSATSIAYKIRTKRVTSQAVLEAFIERLQQCNLELNCLVQSRFDEARAEARRSDAIVASGQHTEEYLERTKPFLGVPFTVKENMAAKGLIHSAGLYRRRDYRATNDATVIQLIQDAGGILLGTTNVSEICMWWDGYNPVYKRTNNAYDLKRTVGGSSGGEGCIQSIAGSGFGVGSDIGGSIRIPASYNGIFGHKSSPFMVSLEGQFPSPKYREQAGFLGVGPMCRHAVDLIPILKVLTKNNPALRLDERVDVRKLRVFYQDSDGGSLLVSPVDMEIRERLNAAVRHFENAHKIKTQRTCLEGFKESAPMWLAGMVTPEKDAFLKLLANYEGTVNVWWEALKKCVGQSHHTIYAIASGLLEKFHDKYDSPKHKSLTEKRNRFRMEMIDLLGEDGVFIYPTHPTPALYHYEPLFKALNFAYTGVFNVLGLPCTHVPLGLNTEGLPIGCQVVAAPNMDRLCLAVARELEKVFGGWVPPHTQL